MYTYIVDMQMYVCMYAHTYVCMYVHIHTYVCMCSYIVYTCMSVCMHTYVCKFTYIHLETLNIGYTISSNSILLRIQILY